MICIGRTRHGRNSHQPHRPGILSPKEENIKNHTENHPADDAHGWITIENLLKFEQLLFQISATYINLPSSEVETVIKSDLGRLGRFLAVDRCNLYFLDHEKKSISFTSAYHWWREEDDAFIAEIIRWHRSDPDFFGHLSYYYNRWSKGDSLIFSTPDELPEEAEQLKKACQRLGLKSFLSVPLSVGNRVVAGIGIGVVHEHRTWPEELVPRLRLAGEVFVNSLARKHADESLKAALSEVQALKAQLEKDYLYLKEETGFPHKFADIVGDSPTFQQILAQVKQVATTDATVLLLGETGTGKGVIAKALHNASRRKHRPFMQVNCAALAPSLVESALFGHERGAFTGADSRQIGWFERANGTTLFLDEIGDISLEMQAKLLRILQDGEFERVGGRDPLKTDVRIIAATNRNLEKEIEAGRFRADLWYRLAVFPIEIPPLRARIEDIPFLLNFFIEKHSKLMGRRFKTIPHHTIRMLKTHPWPGNVRELENIVERAIISSPGEHLRFEAPRQDKPQEKNTTEKLKIIEKDHISRILEKTYWRIEGPSGAAARLGLNPSTLRGRMRKLNIRRPVNR